MHHCCITVLDCKGSALAEKEPDNALLQSVPLARPTLILFGRTPSRYIADETGRVMHDITSKESYRRQFEAIQHCFRIIGFTDKVSNCQERKKLKCSYSGVRAREDVNVLIWGGTLAFQILCWSCYKILLLKMGPLDQKQCHHPRAC